MTPNTLSATEMISPGINLLADVLSASTSVPAPDTTGMPPTCVPMAAQMPTINATPHQLASPSTAATMTAAVREDTDSIQDILASSGINLKEEAEAILREQEAFTSYLPAMSMPSAEDPRSKVSNLFNLDNLSFLLSTLGTTYFQNYPLSLASKNKISIPKSTENGIMEALLYVLQAKLAMVIDELVLTSRHRYESTSSHKSSMRSKVIGLDLN